MVDVLFVIGGLILLVAGGEGVVNSSVMIAERLRLSKLLISAVVIGFGTSMPELVVSVQAALQNAPDIALGNVVGSNICNIALVLGVAAVVYPVACRGDNIRRDVIAGIAASIFLIILSSAGVISRFAGIAMFSMLVAYVYYSVWSDKQQMEITEKDIARAEHKLIVALPLAIVSIALLIGGAKLLVMGAVSAAEKFGISEAVIGLTIIALGTSLPELATAFVAARKKHSDVVIGNVLGSNLFNIMFILGITAIINPIKFIGQIAEQDVWLMLTVSVILLPMVITRQSIGRNEGVMLLVIYASYILWLGVF